MSGKTVFVLAALLATAFSVHVAAAAESHESIMRLVTVNGDLELSGDVNGDYVVNDNDLVEVTRVYGTSVASGTAADLNGDGRVNIYDLKEVGEGFGEGTAGEDCAQLYIIPPSVIVEPGESFKVNVTVNVTDLLYGVSLRLSFNSSVVQASSAAEGTFLENGSSTYYFTIINNTEGFVRYEGTRMGTQDGINGSGVLLTVTFTGAGNGVSPVLLSRYDLVDDRLYTVSVTAVGNGTAMVQPNMAPVISSYSPASLTPSVNEGSSLSFSVSASDPDSDPLTYSWKLDGMQVSTTSSYTYSPGYSASGQHTVNVSVSDGRLWNQVTWQVTVIDVPIACTLNTDCGTDGYVGSSFCDGSSVKKTYRTYTCNSPGQPSAYCSYADSDIIQQTCSYICSAGACVSNQAPTIDAFVPASLTPSVNEGASLSFSVTASDPYGDPLTYSWKLDGSQVSTSSSYTYSPGYGDSGQHTVYVNVSDNGMLYDDMQWTVTVNDVPIACTLNTDCGTDGYVGSSFCDGSSVKKTYRTYTCNDPGTPSAYCSHSDSSVTQQTCSYKCVSGACVSNQAPTIDSSSPSGSTATVNEGQSQAFSVTASDPYGDTLSYSWKLDGASVGSGTSYTYSPGYSAAGTHTLVANVSDPGKLFAVRQWTVTVANVNRAPVISSYSPSSLTPSVKEGVSLSFSVSASDADGDTLTYAWELDGTQVSTSSGYSYRPNYAASGTHAMKATVSDGHGGSASKTWTISVANAKSLQIGLEGGTTEWVDFSYDVKTLGATFSSTDIECVMSSIEGKYNSVRMYDPGIVCDEASVCRWLTPAECKLRCEEERWLDYDPTFPPFLNDLQHLDGTLPFYVVMKNTGELLSVPIND